MKTILITGGNGMTAKRLTEMLVSKNYQVRLLSRKKKPGYFYWNPDEKTIDETVFENLDAIIHLAGATISKRWTAAYKKELYESRINTADLLLDRLQKNSVKIKTMISASGVNYYGTETTPKIFSENDKSSDDFLGNLCKDWEKAAFNFEKTGARVCTVRTAVILSEKGGMLKKILPLAKKNMLSALGSGKQIVPWIHIDDLCRLYIHLLENPELNGAFNAAASQITDSNTFNRILNEALNKKTILPNVPGFVLRLIFGETAGIMLNGSAVSNQKIKDTGFRFEFDELKKAFQDLS